jgi:hypothetical protein
MGIASLIISGFIMLMIFFAMNSRCSAITREIGSKERELRALEQELTRAQTAWDETKVTRKLDHALTRFGLKMDVPREDQLVRMSVSGEPIPGQLAVARLRGPVASETKVAKVSLSSVRKRTRTSTVRRAVKNGRRR